MTNTNEVQVWAGRPSQWVNFGRNVSGLIIFALVVLAVRLVVPADNVGMATFATVRESFRTLIEKRRDIKSVRVSERG